MMNWSELGFFPMRFCSSFLLSEDLPLAASLAESRSLIPGFSVSTWNLTLGLTSLLWWMFPESWFPLSSHHTRLVWIPNCFLQLLLSSVPFHRDWGLLWTLPLFPRLTFLSFAVFTLIISCYPSWTIPVAQIQSSCLLEILGSKALTSGLFHCLTQSLSTTFDLRTDWTFDSNISHKFIKCPGDYDLVCVCVCVLVTQSCPTICDHMGCSPPGSFVHRIFQAITLEWVSIPFTKGSSWPRDRT